MNFPYSEKLRQLTIRLERFETPELTPYSHCSKLNSVLVVFRDVAHILSNLEAGNSNLTMKQLNALTSLFSVLEQFEELFRSCKRETCVQFLLSTPVDGPKYEINALRDAAASAFRQLDLPEVAKLVEISEQELSGQDMVDMKRIMQILIQVSLKKRADTEVDLAARFESLSKLGLEVSQDDTANITIPDLPENLRLVVAHEDVELGRQIGKGQSGTVYLGKMKATGEEAAVKVLFKRSLSQPELESFRREVFAMSILKHPSLLRFLGYTSDAPFYLITEYMANGSLFSVLRQRPESLSPTRRAVIAWEVARGLEYLHGNGVIHRDLKSLNILLDKDNRAKICDLGMARTGRTDGPKTGMIGTAHWMAPEVLMSSPDYDQKVDVYSFGIFLWELLTGELPYKDMKPADLILGVTMCNLRPTIPDNCPPQLKALIEECWAYDSTVRPKMSQVVARLQRPSCHFPGTDEAEFTALLGLAGKGRMSRSMVWRKRRTSATTRDRAESCTGSGDPEQMIRDIERNIGDKVEFTKLLASLLRKQDIAQKIADANGTHVFVEVLHDYDSEISLEVLKGLVKCRSPAIFDADVLNALLEYHNCPDAVKREKAMECLLYVGNQQVNLLTSAPSFLLRLVRFLEKPLSLQLTTKLLELALRLIPTLEKIPSGLVTHLVEFWCSAKQFRKPVGDCIVAAATSKHACRDTVGPDDWRSIFEHFDDAKVILASYCGGTKRLICDDCLIRSLFRFRKYSRIMHVLADLVGKPRFRKGIIDLLPTGQPPEIAAILYTQLFSDTKNYSTLVKLPEFYSVVAHMVVTDQAWLACDVLNASHFKMDLLLETSICGGLAEVLPEAEDENEIHSILNVIATILHAKLVDDFIPLLPVFFYHLFGTSRLLRQPAFLCIASLSIGGVSGIDYAKVVPVAAYYSNSDTSLVRSVAIPLVRDHLRDPGVDLDTTVRLFLGSYTKYHDGDTKVVMDAFAKALISTPINPERAKQLRDLL